jgi:competence protein ComEA
MTRLLLVAGGIALAAFAIWHPAGGPQPLLSAEPGPTASRSPHKGHEPGAQASAVVYVVGAVARPGLYRLSPGARIDDAVAKAGGLLPSADAAGVDLAARVSDGDEINVPRVGEEQPTRRARRTSTSHRSRARRGTKTAAVVDVNGAGPEALAQVPGIGATIAGRIVEVRDRDGPFASYDELLDVAGMTPQRLERAEPYLRLHP